MYGIPPSHFLYNLNPILRTPHNSGLRTVDLGNLCPQPHLLRTKTISFRSVNSLDNKKKATYYGQLIQVHAVFKACIAACEIQNVILEMHYRGFGTFLSWKRLWFSFWLSWKPNLNCRIVYGNWRNKQSSQPWTLSSLRFKNELMNRSVTWTILMSLAKSTKLKFALIMLAKW